jgi:amino acid adenylation domain-containing protein
MNEIHLPLSNGQERLWFLHLFNPDDSAYNLFQVWRLHGRVDTAALRDALGALLARHDVLRARFVDHGGRPVAVVTSTAALPLETIDLATSPRAVAEEKARQLVAERSAAPFDLSSGPVIRASLIRLADDDHVLCVVLHHIVGDGWSLAILRQELIALYDARVKGMPASLPPLPAKYADYVAEQGRAHSTSDGDLKYWQLQLANPPVLELPTDRPRPAVRTSRGATHRHRLPVPLVHQLERLARHEGCTPFMALLTGFSVLLARHSGQTDVCVGFPTAGRNRVEWEPLVGLFVNTLVLRSDLSGEPSFTEMLRRTRARVLQAYEHQDVPLERLINMLDVGRDPSRTPLFQAMFIHQDVDFTEQPTCMGDDLRVSPIDYVQQQAKLDLQLETWRDRDAWVADFTYSADLFDAASVALLAHRFETLLASAVASPERPVGELALLPEHERDLVLRRWNPVAKAPSRGTALDALIAQARRAPDAPAVCFAGRRWTYADLEARVRRIAARLRDLGVGRENVVGVCTHRSADMLATLFAIWHVGAAYLPLDPDYPAERLDYMIHDSGAALLVTTPDLVGGRTVDCPWVDLETLVQAGEHESATTAQETGLASPTDLAYVIYTSGSTGRPKGVEVEHRSLTNVLYSVGRRLHSGPAHVWLAVTSLSFDISTVELFLSLATGGQVVIAPDGASRDAATVLDLVHQADVTHVQATPSGWRLLLNAGFHRPSGTALVGGEPLPPPLARQLRAAVGRLVNVYGPTETTVWSTAWEVPPAANEVSLGDPVNNTQIYLLGRDLCPVPIGVPGEVYIGGDGVARGYRDRPGLTAERFLPDPFGPSGARIYRTGDLARRRHDGTMEFLGRADHQVKLRGHRIELGEIEAALLTHPDIAQAAVAVSTDGQGVAFLAGYLVTRADTTPTTAELRQHLARDLPSYMIPDVYTAIPALPLTPNGKLDRKALPAAERRPARHSDHRAPRTDTEQAIAAVWAGVLGIDEVGALDDFFALGGHSLLAPTVTAELNAAFGQHIPVRLMFAHPSVEDLAQAIDELLSRGVPAERIDRAPDDLSALPVTLSQQRLWFLHRLDPQDASYNMFSAHRLYGTLRIDALQQALTQMLHRHESLRARFVELDGGPIQIIASSTEMDVEYIDLGPVPAPQREEQARRLVSERTNTPFDLAAGPLLRVTALRLADDDYVLCMVQHHIISDGRSLDIFHDELTAMYQEITTGEPSGLPDPALRYRDYLVWHQRQTERDKEIERLDYWRRQLANPPALDLPWDYPRPAVRSSGGGVLTRLIPGLLVAQLQDLARKERATLFMALLAAYQLLLARHAGQIDVCVGTPIDGRDRPEFDHLIGYLVNTLVLRGDLSGNPSFRELLARTRATALAGYARQNIPFEQLITALDGERGTSHTPVFQTMFVLQRDAGAARSLLGLTTAPFDPGFRQAKFDLMLEAWPNSDGLFTAFTYDRGLLAPETVAALAERFHMVLEMVVADPDRPLGDLEMVRPAERRRLLSWGAGPAASLTGVNTWEMIEQSIARVPDAVAVECGERTLTYRQLDETSRHLAASLPGGIVGVCLDRSIDTIPALLATWRAGAAYLALDPEHPQDRLAWLIEDAGVSAVLTTTTHAGRLPASVSQIMVDLPVPEVINSRPRRGDLAYVSYTSGSTGQAKGVVISHRSLAARIGWMRDHYGLRTGDRIVQFASLGFDTHAEEIYPALAAGAAVVLLPDGGVTLPDFLASSAGKAITVLDLPTAYWHSLVDVIDEVSWPEALRLVILGGSQLHSAAVARWRARFGERVRLVNTYGPTEAAIIATSSDLCDGDPPPIGRPICATTAQVLDEHGRPVPPGIPGELYIGGDGLALGYLGRPALTASVFVPDPEGPPGSRRYRTGDRVRWRCDGELEFLGRLDDQVKVRGFRIEPGEVEARLRSHERAGDVAVIARGDTLTAYFTGDGRPEELREHAAEVLPPYMVPKLWAHLDSIPLTRAGKVDCGALPIVEPAGQTAFIPPRTDAERLVADVWRELLRVDAVGVDDDFFTLGGHSLLATRVAARLRKATGIDIPIRILFSGRTVSELASALEELLIAQIGELSDEEAQRLLEIW